jgi:hypothetical protein
LTRPAGHRFHPRCWISMRDGSRHGVVESKITGIQPSATFKSQPLRNQPSNSSGNPRDFNLHHKPTCRIHSGPEATYFDLLFAYRGSCQSQWRVSSPLRSWSSPPPSP